MAGFIEIKGELPSKDNGIAILSFDAGEIKDTRPLNPGDKVRLSLDSPTVIATIENETTLKINFTPQVLDELNSRRITAVIGHRTFAEAVSSLPKNGELTLTNSSFHLEKRGSEITSLHGIFYHDPEEEARRKMPHVF